MNDPFFPAQLVRRTLRPASQLLPLEQRFMFDGAVAASVADSAHAAHAHEAAPPPVPPAVTVRAAEPAKDDGKKEVVLVDTSVANYKSLEAGVRAGVGIVEFDGSRDGLAQIAQWAAGQSGIDAIHILSHGAQGMVDLGSMRLTEATLAAPTTQAELAQLGRALTADGDLLLYGCDVAAGADGARLLAGIAQATGADVAASTDTTGAARLHGNWTLEARDGKIDTRALALADYDGALTVVPFNYPGDANDFAPTLSISKTVSGQTILFTGPEMYLYNNGSPDDGLYPYASDGTSGISLTIKNVSGYSFDISSFGAQSAAGALTFNVVFADGTTAAFTQGGINSAGIISTVSTFNTALNDVKSVTITATDYSTFQNFNITDVKLLPPAAKVATASLGSDSGIPGDFITNTASQLISGTLTANLGSGEKVQVSYDNGGSWSDATTYTVGSKAWSTSTTLAGSNTFVARVSNIDASSTAYSHTYTLDTVAPTTTFSGMTLSADTGASGTDFVTKTASQTIGATLSAGLAAGDTVSGSLDGGNTWVDITSKVSGTTLTWNGASLNAGSSSVMFRVSDAAGNDSPISFRFYTLDTTAPTTTIATSKFSSDSGTLSNDLNTNIAAQTISGTLSANVASGETVYVSLDNGATWSAATAAVGQNAWSLGATLSASSTLLVKVSDVAGNDGGVLSRSYIFDTTAPTTTFSGLSLLADTGASNSDFITKIASQTISATLSGALSAGVGGDDILYGTLDNGATWVDITNKVSGTTLTWNGVTLAGGSNTLQLKVVDAAGNVGTPHSKAYTLDTSAPAKPGLPDLATSSDNGALNNDNITLDTTPTLGGTAENGSTVTLYDGATMLGTVVAGAGGWTYTTGVLSQGAHTITAVATDTAGNVSATSDGLTITIDSVAPTVTSVAVPANGSYGTGGTLDFTVNFDEAVIVDDFGGTPRIALTVGAATRDAVYISGSGTSALVFRYTVPNGDIDANGITVGALSTGGGMIQDAAGNDIVTTLNSVGSTAGVNVDGTNPGVTNISASTADGAYGAGQTITITVDFSTAVDVDTTGGTPTLALAGGGSATYTGGSGSSTLTFSYTVGAGQNSADLDVSSTAALALNGATIIDAGGSHQTADVTLATPGTAGSLGANKDLVIDTTAPGNTIASAAFSADTGTGGDFITKTAAQTLNGTLATNLAADEHVYVSLDNGSTWALASTTAGLNTWSLAGQTLTGSGTLKVRVVDNAGNVGSAYAQAYVLDTTAPTTTFSGITLSADTGVSNSDLITNTAAQTISATLSAAPAAGDIVYGSLDNGATWTDITSKVSGTTLTWNGVTLAASDTLKLRVTDAAANDGAATSAAYVLDTTGPATDVATVAFSADTGNPGDFITRTALQNLDGTLSANLAAGERVLVSLDNGASWSTASIGVGTDHWTLNGVTLTASDTLLVKVSDAAGNDGNVLSQAYVYDTAATVPTVAATTSMSLTPVLSGSATLAAGETMTVTVGGATYNVVPVAGAWSLDLATAVPVSGALTLVLNNQYDVTATVTDLAGNTASDASSGELIVGSVASPAPTTGVTGAALSADSGISNSDFITNVAAQTISGSLSAPLAAGETVQVSLDSGATWQTAAINGSGWSLAGVTLGNGGNQLQVKVSSASGDGPVYTQNYLLDTTPPAAPAVDPLAAPNTTPTLTGSATLDSGDRLSVSVGGAIYNVAVSGGLWSLNLATATPASGTLTLAAGATYEVVATVTDRAGNARSDAGSNELTIAGVPATVVGGVTLSADTGASNSDFITNVAAQTVSGSLSAPLMAGQRVEVSLDGGATWRSATAAIGSTAWSAGVTLSGSNVFMARVSNASGGGLSAPLGAGESVLVSLDGGATFVTATVSGTTWSLPGAASGTVQVVVRDTAGNNGAVLTVNLGTPGQPPVTPPVEPPVVPPVEPPPPPVPPQPVLTQPPAPADTAPADPAPADGAPLILPTVLTPGAGLPVLSGTSIITPTVLAPGVPAPDSPANPLAPSLVVLTDARAQLNMFTPNGLPDLPFTSDMILANAPIADLVVGRGERISVQLAPDTFTTTSASKAGIELSAQAADGTPIPGWLKFDSRTARFEGTPPAGFEGTLSFKVTARDAQGRVAVQSFKIVVTKDGKAAPVTSWSPDLIEPAGRSALNEQMRAARHAGAERLALLSRSAAAAKARA